MRLSGRKYSSSTQHWAKRQWVVLLSLIGINLAVFAAQLVIETFYPGFVRAYLGISHTGVRDAYSWQFVTAMFLHDGPWHLVGNLLILYLLGRDLETILGQRHFLYLYLAGAIGGELGHLFLMPAGSVLLGASGGVIAIVCAYAVILPELELTSSFLSLPLRVKAKHFAYGVVVFAAILLVIDRTGVVCHSAAIGACASGWLYAHLLGFGRPSFLQRFLQRRRETVERYEHLSVEQLMAEKIDPLLEKISLNGFVSLTRSERRALFRAREKMLRDAAIG
ncbi:MAG: rhomboid family intramembrane serine protease [Spartobacteria bacterium]